MPIVLDPEKDGFEKVLRDYQIEALKVVWENPDQGVTSREVYAYVNKALEGVRTVSRASIINFLNSMCEYRVLSYEEETCKGGMRRKYFPALDEEGFKKYIANLVFNSLVKDFPHRTIDALCESLGQYPELKEKLLNCVSS